MYMLWLTQNKYYLCCHTASLSSKQTETVRRRTANGERPYLIAPIVRARMSWQGTMMLDIFFGICVQKEQKKDEQNLAE